MICFLLSESDHFRFLLKYAGLSAPSNLHFLHFTKTMSVCETGMIRTRNPQIGQRISRVLIFSASSLESSMRLITSGDGSLNLGLYEKLLILLTSQYSFFYIFVQRMKLQKIQFL